MPSAPWRSPCATAGAACASKAPMREEVLPKNILMIGPTGCGKTEISRRLAKLANAPFLKVEATKFTEVGYVGRDVEQIVRDLVEIAISDGQGRESARRWRRAPKLAAEERVLDALVGTTASASTRDSFRKKLRARRTRRQGNRDRDRAGRVRDADVRIAEHAGLGDRRDLHRRYFRQVARQSRRNRGAPRSRTPMLR